MDWREIPNHTSIRFSERERQIIAAILKENPYLGDKVARAISYALHNFRKEANEMKTYDTYEEAKANKGGSKPTWKHDAGYYAVASYEEMADHCDQSGEADQWTEID